MQAISTCARDDDFDLNLPLTATIELLEHYLSYFFQFGYCYYQQVKGTPMASPISGLITEAVLQGLERLAVAIIEILENVCL